MYFMGCYMLGYHFLSTDRAVQFLQRVVAVTPITRILAGLACVVLNVLWLYSTPGYDMFPVFLGKWYPIHAILDWASLALAVIAVGEGNSVLRLIGSSILGTMVIHMYL